MKKIFIGVDISKETLDIAYCNTDSDPYNFFKVSNHLKGIQSFIKKIQRLQKNHSVWICFEHTGNYGLLLSCFFENADICYSAVPALEIQKSIGMTRGKSDKIDAGRIAKYASLHHMKLSRTSLRSVSLLTIKNMLTYREQLVKMVVQFKNSLKSYRLTSQIIDVVIITKDIEKRIDELNKTIQKLESEILSIICHDDHLEANYAKITRIKGIGPIIASYLLVTTNNFKSITDPRKFNSYTGTAPFEHTSGTSIRQKNRTSNLRNKIMKKLLFNGANSAVQYDEQLKKYYKRKIAEGKHHMSVINAVSCKLIYRVYAVIKREEPFIDFAH